MKLLPPALFALALLFAPPLFAANEGVDQLITEGKAAYSKGDMVAAKKSFQMAYELDSRNQVAISYLRILANRGTGDKAGGGGNEMERKLAGVIVAKVDFREMPLGDAFEFLRQKTGVSIVLQIPDERLKTQLVTLALRDVPAPEVFKYLADIANLSVTYEKYAVRVKAKDATAATTTAPAPPQ